MTKTVIGLLRHGQTNWNIDFRLQGVTDIPLNETGIEQARIAGEVLAQAATTGDAWDLILSSPLSRARDTAEMVGQAIGVPGKPKGSLTRSGKQSTATPTMFRAERP